MADEADDVFRMQQKIRELIENIRQLRQEYKEAADERKEQIDVEVEKARWIIYITREKLANAREEQRQARANASEARANAQEELRNIREQEKAVRDLERANRDLAKAEQEQASQAAKAQQQNINLLKQLFGAAQAGPGALARMAASQIGGHFEDISTSAKGKQAAGIDLTTAETAIMALTDVAGPVAAALAAIPAAAMMAAGALKSASDAALSFGKFASPGQTQRAERAYEDLYASIGVSLLPIVDATARSLDRLNSLFTELQPVLEPLIQTMSDVVEEELTSIITDLRMLFQEFKPEIQDFISLMMELNRSGLDLVRSFTLFAAIIIEQIHRIREGRFLEAFDMPSVVQAAQDRIRAAQQFGITTAARPATMIATEQIGVEARLAAFGARSISAQHLDATRDGNAILRDIRDRMPSGFGYLGNPAFAAETPGGTVRFTPFGTFFDWLNGR
jgi:hypothetical protein